MEKETTEADVSSGIVGNTDVNIQPSNGSVAYKTKVIYLDRQVDTIVSVTPPQVQQSGMIQFITHDRVIVIPIGVIRRSETEQIKALEPSKIIVSAR